MRTSSALRALYFGLMMHSFMFFRWPVVHLAVLYPMRLPITGVCDALSSFKRHAFSSAECTVYRVFICSRAFEEGFTGAIAHRIFVSYRETAGVCQLRLQN